ncbi:MULTISPECIES: TrkH family potassium uptake protein [unclassified Acinetobacter]|uniref:TrkH family potassium uptake protein n=1 Tax=unclassified Acinetobacter TaxID=196816 RepID=UPI0035B8626A
MINLSPPSLLALGFAFFIILGTFLLKLPISHHGDLRWMDAFFTATSAVTITGLATIGLDTHLTLFGQFIVLLLIQAGGLGFMTFAILVALTLSPKLGLKQQIFAQNTLGQTSLASVKSITFNLLIYTLAFECIGFLILTAYWAPIYGFEYGAFYAFFYSVSAFNNAGFSLFSDGLLKFRHDLGIFYVLSGLYIIGGTGFIVLMDIKKNRSWKKISTNSKIILSGMLVLNTVAFILIYLLEQNNPLTLGHMSVFEKITHAWFHATVPRSSGFNSVDMAALTPASIFLTAILMFIGGGSLSTAGGIKIGTFVILILTVITFFRSGDEVTVFKRSISPESSFKALAVAFATCIYIVLGVFVILIFDPKLDFLSVLFEVISAVCTVGLSRGITGQLSDQSLSVICFLMFAGRLGPITLIYLIASSKKSHVRHPNAEIQIG